jgi:phosphoserine phosphatase
MSANEMDLVVFDMEGTLTASPTAWELMHGKVGTWDSHGLPYWEQYKAGVLGYDEFARLDTATWKGAPVELLDRAVEEVPLMEGCRELLAHLAARGVRTAIVSNGLERLGLRLAREFGIARVLANRELLDDGRLTGELELAVPFARKGEMLSRIAGEMGIPTRRVVAVGDGPADIAMFERAGSSIAFLPSSREVAARAKHVVERADLRLLIPLLQ